MAQRQGLMPSLEAFDGEFRGHDNNIAREPSRKDRLRLIALLSLLFGIGVVGVLVLAWPLAAVSSRPESPLSERIEMQPNSDLSGKQIGEVAAPEEELIATVAPMKGTVEEPRERARPDQHWYSDLAALSFRTRTEEKLRAAPDPTVSPEVPAEKDRKKIARRSVAPVPKEHKSTVAPLPRLSAEARAEQRHEKQARRRGIGAPLSLLPPQ